MLAGFAHAALSVEPLDRKYSAEEVNSSNEMDKVVAAASFSKESVKIVIELSPTLVAQLTKVTTSPSHPEPTLKNAAYVLFTSRSSGKVKGVVVEHYAPCLSINIQCIS